MMNRLLILFCFSVVIIALTGCNSKHYISTELVEGYVTLDGQPFDNVVVTFLPINSTGEMGFASTDNQGKFRISTLAGKPDSGTTVAEYKVVFNKEIEDVSKRKFDKDQNGKEIVLPNLTTVQMVPKKYLNPETSGITVQVKKGKNVFNFDLVSQDIPRN
jgi:hypothetical protein